jgi:hypothetical protein
MTTPKLEQRHLDALDVAWHMLGFNRSAADLEEVAAILRASEERINETSRLYHELLYNVSIKHPNESRHETALRYIRQAERQDNPPMAAKSAHLYTSSPDHGEDLK